MKTPEELKKIEKSYKEEQERKYKESERKYKEEQEKKRISSVRQAGLDVERALELLEYKVSTGRVWTDNKGHKYYIIENYHNPYAKSGELKECYLYDSQNKSYWRELTNLLKERGFKAQLDETTNEVYDSMSTYETYCIFVTL